MSNDIVCITESNLSHAWGRVFMHVMERPGANPPPLMLTMTGFNSGGIAEDESIRHALEGALETHRKNSVDISAMLVFPYRQWVGRKNLPREEFYRFCVREFAPRLKARDSRNNRGIYFERMMAFRGSPAAEGNEVNQLEHIIQLWASYREHNRGPRRSAMQVAIFDPLRDHNRLPLCIFPCLQQVAFNFDNSGGLIVNAFYPTQYIFDRAYGNYLGLLHLGEFMATGMGLKLVRLNCFISNPELGGNVGKGDLRDLQEVVRNALPKE